MKRLISILLIVCLTACQPQSQSRYAEQQVGTVQEVLYGTIKKVRQVNITGTNTGTGGVVGATGGALAGSYIGNGKGALFAMLATALVGGLAGHAAEQALHDRKGFEYIIRLENKRIISVTQNIASDDKPLRVGQSVMVQVGACYTRVMPEE